MNKDDIKELVYRYCCGIFMMDEEPTRMGERKFCDDNMRKVFQAFEEVGFDIDEFAKRGQDLLDDDELFCEVMMELCCFMQEPISEFWLDWMNGELDFTVHDTKSKDAPISDVEILQMICLAKDKLDLWDLYAQGFGDISSLYKYYNRDDSQVALSFLMYILIDCPPDYEFQIYPDTRKEKARTTAFLHAVCNHLYGDCDRWPDFKRNFDKAYKK